MQSQNLPLCSWVIDTSPESTSTMSPSVHMKVGRARCKHEHSQALLVSHQLAYSCWLYDLGKNAQVPCDMLTQPHKVESNPRSSNNVWIQSPEWAWEYESDQTQAHTCHYRHLTCWHVCMVSTVSKQHILWLNQNWLSLTLILDLEVSSKSNVQPDSTEKVESNLVTWPDMVE